MKTLIATLIASAGLAIVPAQAQTQTQTQAQSQSQDKAAAGSGGLISRIDTSDPVKAEAVAKCEQMTGNARTSCLVDHKGNVTSAGAAASATGAAIAENTRNAAANAAEGTREAARTAADKTREMAASVAEKTGMAGAGERTREAVATVKEKTAAAVDRTKEMASNAARKTGDAADRAGERTARAASDSAITTKVKAGLVAEPDLSGMEIAVDTEQGVVMLSGFVESKAEADRAVQLAKSVEGVTSVKSAIKVK
jgi:osmotically-inducible protein OsmY